MKKKEEEAELKMVSIRVDADLWRLAKVESARRDITLKEFVMQAMKLKLKEGK